MFGDETDEQSVKLLRTPGSPRQRWRGGRGGRGGATGEGREAEMNLQRGDRRVASHWILRMVLGLYAPYNVVFINHEKT